MSACEACWTRAYGIARRTGQSQAEVYRQLIQHPCESDITRRAPCEQGNIRPPEPHTGGYVRCMTY